MRRSSVPTGVALTIIVFALAVPAARAQDSGGVVPGVTSERKVEGGTSFTCTARNALGTQQCSTTCPSRETADCEDSDGGSPPTCQCTGG